MLLQPQRSSPGKEAGERPRGISAPRPVLAVPRQAQRTAGRTAKGGRRLDEWTDLWWMILVLYWHLLNMCWPETLSKIKIAKRSCSCHVGTVPVISKPLKLFQYWLYSAHTVTGNLWNHYSVWLFDSFSNLFNFHICKIHLGLVYLI